MPHFRTRASLFLLASLYACSSPPESVESSSAESLETRPGDPLPSFGPNEWVWLDGHANWAGNCIRANGVGQAAGIRACAPPYSEGFGEPGLQYTVEHLPNGYYRFHRADNGNCLDAGSGENGARVVEKPCGGESSQWRSIQLAPDGFRLVNVASSRCLDLDLRDNHTLQVWDCHDGENQRWRVHRATTFRIAVDDGGKCVDVPASSMDDGVGIQQWTCGTQDNQEFFVTYHAESNDYEFRALHSGKCLAFQDAGDTNGTPLVQMTCTGGSEQRLRLDPKPGSIWDEKRIRPAYIDKCMARWGAVNHDDGASIVLWNCQDWSSLNELFTYYTMRY